MKVAMFPPTVTTMPVVYTLHGRHVMNVIAISHFTATPLLRVTLRLRLHYIAERIVCWPHAGLFNGHHMPRYGHCYAIHTIRITSQPLPFTPLSAIVYHYLSLELVCRAI